MQNFILKITVYGDEGMQNYEIVTKYLKMIAEHMDAMHNYSGEIKDDHGRVAAQYRFT